MKSEFETLFYRIFSQNGLEPYATSAIGDKLEALTERMLQVNQQMNLTAITQLPDLIAKHYADSLSVAPFLPQGARVLDVGCGAGFPSLPLAIARPDLAVTALDSTAKRVSYVSETATLLELSRFSAVVARAEEAAAPGSPLRESFDCVVSRAVANLPMLCELCLPFVRIGGVFIAMKGQQAAQELEASVHAIALLGGSLDRTLISRLSLDAGAGNEERALIFIKKAEKTPKTYPRIFSQIKKKPL